jgi:hypothetical protein
MHIPAVRGQTHAPSARVRAVAPLELRPGVGREDGALGGARGAGLAGVAVAEVGDGVGRCLRVALLA